MKSKSLKVVIIWVVFSALFVMFLMAFQVGGSQLQDNLLNRALKFVFGDPYPKKSKQNVHKINGPWRSTSISELINSMHEIRISNLHYENIRLPDNMLELDLRENTTEKLVQAYYSEQNDGLFRFNIIIMLNRTLRLHDPEEIEEGIIARCLIRSLQDSEPMVRAESVWGLRLTKNRKFELYANSLLSDTDADVRINAQQTVNILQEYPFK